MDGRREFGNQGEATAAKFLEDHGFRILERQWRSPFGEVDLISEDAAGELVFVEVKSRRSLEAGFPEDSVTPAKLRHLEASAECFLEEVGWSERPYRFDVVAIIESADGQTLDIQHLTGV